MVSSKITEVGILDVLPISFSKPAVATPFRRVSTQSVLQKHGAFFIKNKAPGDKYGTGESQKFNIERRINARRAGKKCSKSGESIGGSTQEQEDNERGFIGDP